MKTTGYIFGIAAMLLLVLATSCSNSDVISDIADDAPHTATMKLIGGVRGFDDSRADADGWSDGDVIYLNFNTAGGVIEGKAAYNKATDTWSVSYNGTLIEGVATQCQVYYFDAIESANDNKVVFNYLTAVYADKNASYFYKDGAISITALLMPQTARFRFKGTPGTEFTVYGFNGYDGYSSKALTQSDGSIYTRIESDGYSPYIYGFLSSENAIFGVYYGEYNYSRTINDTEFAQGRTGKFTLPTEDSFTGWEKEENDLYIVNGISFKMIYIEAGTFIMGATEEQAGADSDETPPHQVTITKDYYMGETEVTQALWYAVMGQKPTSDGSEWSSTYGLGDNYPAYFISWNDCQKFITKLNQLTGLTFRLPTEAEWEYAARGGNKATTQTLYSGSNTIGDVAWYDDNSSSSTHAFAGKSANALGLYDMSGNVWEWCNDWYGSYSSGAQTDPTGSSSGSSRVLRGGSWGGSATSCRVAYRYSSSVVNRSYDSGMRLALTAE